MAGVDYELEYNNRARVPEHPAIFERWTRDAAVFRAGHLDAELALSYGQSARQTLDLFWPRKGRAAPIALFIHGGYWRSLDRSMFSHLARGVNERGIALALPGYDLCPMVTIATIIDQMRAAATFLWRRHGRRLLACGHSAGGHLAACLLATDWRAHSQNLVPDLVPAAFSISGLFDLEPLIKTSINQDLRLDPAQAREASPLFWKAPKDRVFDSWVGGEESSEFLRQSRTMAEAWGAKGIVTRHVEVAGANHFTVLDPMSKTESELTERLVALASVAAKRPIG
jgi:arylformamidase